MEILVKTLQKNKSKPSDAILAKPSWSEDIPAKVGLPASPLALAEKPGFGINSTRWCFKDCL